MKCGKQQSWHEAAQDLRTKLSRYAAKSRFNGEFEEAFAFFFGEGPDEMQDQLEPAAFGRFMEWFIHDYRLGHGHRLIELFEMEYATELPCRMRHLLEVWQKSTVTLLEIVTIERGVAGVRDVLLGGEYDAILPAPANVEGTPAVGRLVVGRLMRVGEQWEMPYGVTVLPAGVRDRFLQLLRGEYRRFSRNRDGGWPLFLQEQGFVFNDLIDSIGDDLASQDQPLQLFIRVIYDVLDMQVCISAMRDVVGGNQAYPALEGRVGLMQFGSSVELRLKENRLEVVCSSVEEVKLAKELVASKLGGAVDHRFDVFEQHRDRQAALTPLLRPEIVTPRGHRLRAESSSEMAASVDEGVVTGDCGQQELQLGGQIPVAMSKPAYHSESQREVARRLSSMLAQTGASPEHIDSALWLWSDFCCLERPRIRQVPAWAAAVHVTLGRVEGWRLRNSTLARVYGAHPTSVGRNAALIASTLEVQQFDDRYCVEHPVDGLLKRLGHMTELEAPQQAEELLGASSQMMVWEQTELAESLVALRNVLFLYAQGMEALTRRAHEHFFAQVGCCSEDPFWQACFTDWFHFDWAIPVRGGLTILELALAEGEIQDPERDQLAAWQGCHPAYYVVEAVQQVTNEPRHGGVRLTLRLLCGESRISVVWPLPAESLKKGDVILTRLVPFEGVVTSIGHALHFNAALASAIRLRLQDERDLLEHWNGRKMKWRDISSGYAERLYAIAYRAARGFFDEV